jgi:hypothetical protein
MDLQIISEDLTILYIQYNNKSINHKSFILALAIYTVYNKNHILF